MKNTPYLELLSLLGLLAQSSTTTNNVVPFPQEAIDLLGESAKTMQIPPLFAVEGPNADLILDHLPAVAAKQVTIDNIRNEMNRVNDDFNTVVELINNYSVIRSVTRIYTGVKFISFNIEPGKPELAKKIAKHREGGMTSIVTYGLLWDVVLVKEYLERQTLEFLLTMYEQLRGATLEEMLRRVNPQLVSGRSE